MTVSTIASIAEFDTNGVTTNYPFYFKFLANEDLVVTYINPAGTSTVLTLGTHYTVNGAGKEEGGSVVTTTALAGPGQLVVARDMEAFQQTSLRNQGKFLAEVHEDVFDRLTMLIQQGLASTMRALKRPFGRDYFYAEGRRIVDLQDPTSPQDAATKKSVEAYVASILETGQGPINNATNVAYVDGDGVATSVQKGILKQFSSVASLKLSAGAKDGEPAVLLSYYSSAPGIGGGMVRWSSTSTLADDGGYCFAVTGVPVGRWLRTDRVLDLYQFGGAYQGNCIAAFDLAMASTFMYIKVPDKVVLGYHVFSAPIKFVRGGDQVSFSTFPAGILPTLCGYVKIHGFTNLTMAVHPLSGGNIETAQFFVAPGPAADIGTIIIVDNDGTGGRAGILASFENGRFLRKSCVITNNHFKNQNGTEGGEGYGIQYANENEFGDAYINFNTVEEDGRHGIYLARNPGGGKITLIGNTVLRHRWNSPTQGTQVRGAIQITRCANVHGYGNFVNGFYDSAMMIIEENESESLTPISATNITLRDTTIDGPANDTPAIYLGYGTSSTTAHLQRVTLDGVEYTATGIAAPLLNYNWGKDVTLRGAKMIYRNITSGAIRPLVLVGGTLSNSKGLLIEDTTFSATGCSGAAVEVFRLVGNTVTTNIPMRFDGLRVIESDASSLMEWGPSATITNTEIQIDGVGLTGFAATSKPKVIPSPSQPWNGQVTAASILTPVGTLLPAFVGQEAFLSNNNTFWKASGLANTNWIQIS